MAHCNTIFHHMLKLIPRHHFSRLAREHGTGRPARTFSRWHQLVHFIFMQVASRASLRDKVAALKARFPNLYHLGVGPLARSTSADANNRRPPVFPARNVVSMIAIATSSFLLSPLPPAGGEGQGEGG